VTLLCIAIAAALLIAPPIHHRLLFRQGEKRYLVDVGNRFLIVAMAFLTLGFTGILVLISHVVFGSVLAAVVGACAAVILCLLWFGMPLMRLRKLRGFSGRRPG
jgi:hypothetical protein